MRNFHFDSDNASSESQTQILNKNFECLKIVIPEYLRDSIWATNIGTIQELISSGYQANPNAEKKLVFDFEKCRWVDPIPLMSILLEIVSAINRQIVVEVKLPNPDEGVSFNERGPYQNSPNRMLLFLTLEGFLDCLSSLENEGLQFTNKPDGGFSVYRDLPVRPSYENMLCIPMKLYSIPDISSDVDFAQKTVEDLLVGMNSKLEALISPKGRELLIYKLRVALQEILHNAQEHAYGPGETNRLISVYVRYRTGGLGLDTEGLKAFKECIKEEDNCCPRLGKEWLSIKPGCLELFAIDRGMGIVKTFENAGVELKWKYKFQEVMHKTFFDGESTKKERQTRYGGLHLLYNMLKDTGDYIRAFEKSMWFGSGTPFFRRTARNISFNETDAECFGLAFHLRLSWKEKTDHGDNWARFSDPEYQDVIAELMLDESEIKDSCTFFKNQTVIDERFGNVKTFGDNSDWILWLVRPHRMKWDIITFLERNISPIIANKSILIISDIPSYEAETYIAALSEFQAYGRQTWPNKFSRIILSSDRWRFSTVKYKNYEGRHGFSKVEEDFSSLRIAPPPVVPVPKNFRLGIIRWLKWHDSMIFWSEVNDNDKFYINEEIAWSKDRSGNIKYIDGYLDFPQATRNSICSSIFRIALGRIFGLFSPDKTELVPIDRLTKPILRELLSSESYKKTYVSMSENLLLGSVLVSGSTLNAAFPSSKDIHFFAHNNSPLRGKKPTLLYWLPSKKISNSASNYARIGKTATIGPAGWKSFEVPRFDDKLQCIGDRHPSHTYKDWQSLSPIIIKSGHWEYEGHHDFLTVNIANAVEAAFYGKKELASFLVSNILPFIGISKSEVDVNWQRIYNEKQNNLLDPPGILVYRSHPSSDSIIHRLINILSQSARQISQSRIFPILPVRTRWNNSTFLIPPMVRENIISALQSASQSKSILLFDDAAITGRTLQDLRAALSSMGAEQIKTLIIANRLRQPADGYGNERITYYWRLDVPEMGREGNCPLCYSLNLGEKFLSSLSSRNAKNEIKEILNQWSDTSPMENWSAGLKPLLLTKHQEGTRFCYRLDLSDRSKLSGSHLSTIDLFRSTGLLVHITELHAMTGRDDYCIKKINKHKEPEIRIEIAASQLLLFGNEFDIDILYLLLKTLIAELPNIKENSPHASLAFLTIISRIWLLDKEARKEVAKTVQQSSWDHRLNYIAKILIAYLVSEDLLDRKCSAHKTGKSLLHASSWKLAHRFNSWFLEILSPRGNAHSETIPLLLYEITNDVPITKARLKDVMDSIDFLTNIIESLERTLVRKEMSGVYLSNVETMEISARKLQKLLSDFLNNTLISNWKDEVKNALQSFIVDIKKVSDSFFHRIPSTKEYYKNRTFETIALSQIIHRIDWIKSSFGKTCNGKPLRGDNRIIKFSLAGELNFENNAEEVWIPWHRLIAGILIDLFRNTVYATKMIHDPWDEGEKDFADLWLKVDYQKKQLVISMANCSTCGSIETYSNLKKHRWTHLEEVGGKIEPLVELSSPLTGLTIIIPYVAHLV